MPVAPRNYWRALWPSFLVALPAAALLFGAVDPRELVLFGVPLALGRSGAYTAAFAALWLLCWAASVLNLWMFGNVADDDAEF
jgi:hypothetical protein